jgi:hypothetical protein
MLRNGCRWKRIPVKSDVFFLARSGHADRRPLGQLLTDAVDKVGDEQRAGNNRIQVPSFLNLYCAPGFLP